MPRRGVLRAPGHPAQELDVRLLGLPSLSQARTDLVDGHARGGDALQHWPGRVYDDLRLLQDESHDAPRHADLATPAAALEFELRLRLVVRGLLIRWVRIVVWRVGFDGGRRRWRELLSIACRSGTGRSVR
jgi:hypothetical protein